MPSRLVLHISEVEPSHAGGMGRVVLHWREAFETAGFEFVHIGPSAVGKLPHQAFFSLAAFFQARRFFSRHPLIIVHEPASGPFAFSGLPFVIESHGIERRAWKLGLRGKMGEPAPGWRTRLFFPLWRLLPAETGLRSAAGYLLSNFQDEAFLKSRIGDRGARCFIFSNGVNLSKIDERVGPPENDPAILFMGSWIPRKGIDTLVRAAEFLFKKGVRPRWILAATNHSRERVLFDWPEEMHPYLEVVPTFPPDMEERFFAGATVFVLPSYFEGQALSLLQAMACGRCCIVSRNSAQRDLIAHGKNGFLFPTGDSGALCRLIEQSLKNTEIRKGCGREARRWASNKSWSEVGADVVKFVERVLREE